MGNDVGGGRRGKGLGGRDVSAVFLFLLQKETNRVFNNMTLAMMEIFRKSLMEYNWHPINISYLKYTSG